MSPATERQRLERDLALIEERWQRHLNWCDKECSGKVRVSCTIKSSIDRSRELVQRRLDTLQQGVS